MTSVERPDFRHDINALRAVAVSLVVLYHFGFPGFSFGYLGVDIFIVISGYLMAQIITGLDQRNFSGILDFWLGRIRRIVPAFYVFLIALLIFGFIFLISSSFKGLANDVKSAALFSYNHKILTDSAGYFFSVHDERWVLHTWSLALEFQYYLIYPFIVYFLKDNRKKMLAAHGFMVGGSIIFSALVIYFGKEDVAFASLPARAWEFALGGMVFLLGNLRPKYVGLLGLLFLGAGFAVSTDQWALPSAVLVALGTSGILLAKLSNPMLRSAPIQFLGNISYSFYLWHWPAALLPSFLFLEGLFPKLVSGFAALGLAYLSWRYVEIPTRQNLIKVPPKRQMLGFLSALVLCLMVTQAIRSDYLVPKVDFGTDISAVRSRQFHALRCDGIDFTVCKGEGEPEFAILGDSHANYLTASLVDRHDLSFRAVSRNGCPMLPQLGQLVSPGRCGKDTQKAFESLPELLPIIVMLRLRDEPEYADVLANDLCLIAQNRKVYLLESIPTYTYSAPQAFHTLSLFSRNDEVLFVSESDHRALTQRYHELHATRLKTCGVSFIPTASLFCKGGKCPAWDETGLLYSDTNHLSRLGGDRLADHLISVVRSSRRGES